jgi:hypothetical protein
VPVLQRDAAFAGVPQRRVSAGQEDVFAPA